MARGIMRKEAFMSMSGVNTGRIQLGKKARRNHGSKGHALWCTCFTGFATLLLLGLFLEPAWSQQYQLDPATLVRIRGEAIDHSEVGEYMSYLADVYGPRMTGSPNYSAAANWVTEALRRQGLQNVHQERIGEINFAENLRWSGRGWSYNRCSVRMVQPQQTQLLAIPAGWSHGTGGKVVADTVVAAFPGGPGQVDQYVKAFRGKLKGRIV